MQALIDPFLLFIYGFIFQFYRFGLFSELLASVICLLMELCSPLAFFSYLSVQLWPLFFKVLPFLVNAMDFPFKFLGFLDFSFLALPNLLPHLPNLSLFLLMLVFKEFLFEVCLRFGSLECIQGQFNRNISSFLSLVE